MLNVNYSTNSIPESTLSSSGTTDKQLWQRLKDGDEAVFAYIYEHYSDELYSYGMKVRINRSLVQDCMHDLFVDLWRQRRNLSSTDNIKFYLFRALRRRITYAVNRDKKLYTVRPQEDYEDAVVSFPFENLLINRQSEEDKRNKMRKAVSELSQRQKEVVELIFFQEMSYGEVSEIMSISIRSVYTLAWKAITSIKKQLAEVFFVPVFLIFL